MRVRQHAVHMRPMRHVRHMRPMRPMRPMGACFGAYQRAQLTACGGQMAGAQRQGGPAPPPAGLPGPGSGESGPSLRPAMPFPLHCPPSLYAVKAEPRVCREAHPPTTLQCRQPGCPCCTGLSFPY